MTPPYTAPISVKCDMGAARSYAGGGSMNLTGSWKVRGGTATYEVRQAGSCLFFYSGPGTAGASVGMLAIDTGGTKATGIVSGLIKGAKAAAIAVTIESPTQIAIPADTLVRPAPNPASPKGSGQASFACDPNQKMPPEAKGLTGTWTAKGATYLFRQSGSCVVWYGTAPGAPARVFFGSAGAEMEGGSTGGYRTHQAQPKVVQSVGGVWADLPGGSELGAGLLNQVIADPLHSLIFQSATGGFSNLEFTR